MYSVLASGTAVVGSGQTIAVGNSFHTLLVKATSGTAVIKINGFSIAIATITHYDQLPISHDRFVIVSGTIDYVALG